MLAVAGWAAGFVVLCCIVGFWGFAVLLIGLCLLWMAFAMGGVVMISYLGVFTCVWGYFGCLIVLC